MAHSAALVETLKRELRARKITYATVAKHIGMSEVSVKRMFSRKEFTLSRLDRICALAQMELSDLARLFAARDSVISQLTLEQERELASNQKLILVALCVLNHWTHEEMIAVYDLKPAECVALLLKLDRLKFIQLLPNNRYRLIVSRAFAWIPDGPIQQLFKTQAQGDFFKSRFDRDDEILLMTNGAISKASVVALFARLRSVATEFAEIRSNEAGLPAQDRVPLTMLLTARSWEPQFLRKYRRATQHRPLPPQSNRRSR